MLGQHGIDVRAPVEPAQAAMVIGTGRGQQLLGEGVAQPVVGGADRVLGRWRPAPRATPAVPSHGSGAWALAKAS